MKSTVTIDISVSDDEKKIVGCLAKGLSVSEVGKEVKTETRVLEYKIAKLKARLQCDTAAQLVAYFLRNKLID